MHDADVTRAPIAAAAGGPGAVGEHEPGVRERRAHGRRVRVGAEHVAAVDRDHQRDVRGGSTDGVPRRDRVVRVDQVERELGARAA